MQFRRSRIIGLLALICCSATTAGCAKVTTEGSGGTTAAGGSRGGTGGASGSQTGGTTSNKGGSASGGTTAMGGTTTSGSSGGQGVTGGTTATGGNPAVGGNSTTSPSGGNSSIGGASIGGSSSAKGGDSGTGGAGGTASAGVTYKLPPPDQCHDQDFIPYDYNAKKGCLDGDATTDCGGKCTVANACTDPPGSKAHADYTFMCQRNLLFSPEMEQAAADDGNAGFHYAVVGHDVGDPGGIDGNAQSACCQCYQLVYAYPSPSNDRQVQVNPDNPNPPASAIPVPPPLIAQAFNTGATPTTFDVYMPAGGLGANNACAQVGGAKSGSGLYMYTSYPADGQPSQGGVKPASLYQECKTNQSWVTQATLTSAACVQKTADACNKIASNIPGLTQQGQSGCIKTNTIDTFYHLNWSVYVAKVECPENLTRVTGCKLAPQGLPAVKKDVKTAAQAAKDPDFRSKTGGGSNMYETTTMEDCCRPSCSAITWTTQKGLVTDPQYRAFYLCNANGVPYTQAP